MKHPIPATPLHKKLILSAIIGASAATVVASYELTNPHIGPPEAYPNPQYTTGLIATSDFNELTAVTNGLTYSKSHRQTSQALKAQIRSEYPNCSSPNEIDHYIPLALGGADEASNLWCEPDMVDWNGQNVGYHVKDSLENFLVNQMKAGLIPPKDAQDCIQRDWLACFKKYQSQISGSVKFGSIEVPVSYDGEDEVEH